MTITDCHSQRILEHIKNSDDIERARCSVLITGREHSTDAQISNAILEMDYREIEIVEKEVCE